MYLIRKELVYGLEIHKLDPAKISLHNPILYEKLRQYEVGPLFGPSEYVQLEKEIGYWRKANHIHRWFVQYVQDGRDDCDEYLVTNEHLEALRETCRIALGCFSAGGNLLSRKRDFLKSILPVQEGFFFGNTDYDLTYFEDVKKTIEIIDSAMKQVDWKEETVYYYASW